MFEYLIIFGAVFSAFASLILVLTAKKTSDRAALHTGCSCKRQKEKTRCEHGSEPIRLSTNQRRQTHSP